MPPAKNRSDIETLVSRFREAVKGRRLGRRLGRSALLEYLNRRYFKSSPITLPTLDKLSYGPLGRNVSATTALGLEKFLKDHAC